MGYPERKASLPDFSTPSVHADEMPPHADAVSTGSLPDVERVRALIETAHSRYRDLDEGTVADYIPSLGAADPALFGISVCGVAGLTTSVGDSAHRFSIQSVSKVFVFALVCHELGHAEVSRLVGVNNTGLPFNSVMALELADGDPRNPLVNAGALTTTGLVPGTTPAAKWSFIRDGLSRFAGHPLELDTEVYASEAATNQRNMAIARLLESYGRMEFDPVQTTDVYTKQCSLLVSAEDLAVMAATLANGGVNPITHETVIDAGRLPRHSRGDGHLRPLRVLRRLALRGRASPRRAACRAESSRSHPARAASAPSRRDWTRPATACEVSALRATSPVPSVSTSSPPSRSRPPLIERRSSSATHRILRAFSEPS